MTKTSGSRIAEHSRITATFQAVRAKGEKVLIAYVMAGDPSLEDTEHHVWQIAEAGADIIELGVPFSDPIADGPVIQAAAERALRAGVTLRKILGLVRTLRAKTVVPLVLMVYYNTILKYGESAFCKDASEAGVDGMIVPDLPPDEAHSLRAIARSAHLDVIFLLAPTSTPKRQASVARLSQGFIYYVSLTGITGGKLADTADVAKKVREIRRYTKTPIAVGFGIATADDARRIAAIADGVIVGTALVKLIAADGVRSVVGDGLHRFIRTLKSAMLTA